MDLFGYKSGRVVDKFEGFDVQTDEAGNPYVRTTPLARISCKIVEKLDWGPICFISERLPRRRPGRRPCP